MTERNTAKKKEKFTVKTFPVPFALVKIKENISISANSNVQSSKEEIINQAFKFHSQGNIQEAVKYYQDFIDRGFEDYRVFSNYGAILQVLGQLKEAELSARKAIEIKPDFAEAHSTLGSILKDLGKLEEAELSQRKAIEIKPDFAEAHYNLGYILKDLQNLDESIYSFKRAIELKKDFKEAMAAMGAIMTLKGNYKEGLEKIKEGHGSIIFDHIKPEMKVYF